MSTWKQITVNGREKDITYDTMESKTPALDQLTSPDMVNHPPHYKMGEIEVIDAIEDWELDFHRANAVKYIARAPYKKNFVEDLKKAVFYLERKIEQLNKQKNN